MTCARVTCCWANCRGNLALEEAEGFSQCTEAAELEG